MKIDDFKENSIIIPVSEGILTYTQRKLSLGCDLKILGVMPSEIAEIKVKTMWVNPLSPNDPTRTAYFTAMHVQAMLKTEESLNNYRAALKRYVDQGVV